MIPSFYLDRQQSRSQLNIQYFVVFLHKFPPHPSPPPPAHPTYTSPPPSPSSAASSSSAVHPRAPFACGFLLLLLAVLLLPVLEEVVGELLGLGEVELLLGLEAA